MNKIIIKGRLTRDPELKTGANGNEFCKFTVAVDRKPVSGKEREADFFDCTAFGKTAVAIDKFMAKGREILIDGRMESSKGEAKDGTKRTYWGVVVENFEFCGKKDEPSSGYHVNPIEVDSQTGLQVVNTEDVPF